MFMNQHQVCALCIMRASCFCQIFAYDHAHCVCGESYCRLRYIFSFFQLPSQIWWKRPLIRTKAYNNKAIPFQKNNGEENESWETNTFISAQVILVKVKLNDDKCPKEIRIMGAHPSDLYYVAGYRNLSGALKRKTKIQSYHIVPFSHLCRSIRKPLISQRIENTTSPFPIIN